MSHGAPRARMICSSEQPHARGAFECSDFPEDEGLDPESMLRALGRRRRADRETLRDIGPPCGATS